MARAKKSASQLGSRPVALSRCAATRSWWERTQLPQLPRRHGTPGFRRSLPVGPGWGWRRALAGTSSRRAHPRPGDGVDPLGPTTWTSPSGGRCAQRGRLAVLLCSGIRPARIRDYAVGAQEMARQTHGGSGSDASRPPHCSADQRSPAQPRRAPLRANQALPPRPWEGGSRRFSSPTLGPIPRGRARSVAAGTACVTVGAEPRSIDPNPSRRFRPRRSELGLPCLLLRRGASVLAKDCASPRRAVA